MGKKWTVTARSGANGRGGIMPAAEQLVRYEAPQLLAQPFEALDVPADWSVRKSVEVMAARLRSWKSLTAEILSELYIAREILSRPHSHKSGWADYCRAVGIPRSTANGWLRRALMAELSHEENSHGYPKAIFTGENEWYTPTEFLEAAREVLGGFDLDPASSIAAQKKVKASQYFDKERDGLAVPWRGRVWLNPPYSQPAIGEFVSKLVAELHAGHVAAAVMLTHNYTDAAWFHEAARGASSGSSARRGPTSPQAKPCNTLWPGLPSGFGGLAFEMARSARCTSHAGLEPGYRDGPGAH